MTRTIKSAFCRTRSSCVPGQHAEADPVGDDDFAAQQPPGTSDDGGGEDGGRVWLGNVTDRGRKRYYRSLPQIASAARAATGGWPRSAGGQLFALSEIRTPLPTSDTVRWIRNEPDLFAFLSTRCDVRWTNKEAVHPVTRKPANPPTKAELLAYLANTPEFSYRGVEVLPHEPSVPDVYYLPAKLPPPPRPEDCPGGLTPLRQLLSKFNPETPMDRDLMLAALLTPGWGGPPGARPTFCMTSRFGRTTGKTQTAAAIAAPWGGATKVGAKEDRDRTTSRLIDDVSRRCVLVDNIKGTLSDEDLERLMTSDTIEGWKLYHGQASRPNRLTWFLTSNTPSLSTDLVERSVVIHIGDRHHEFDFVTWSGVFIAQHRAEILAELYALLRSPPACQIRPEGRDRWVAWQDAVLARFSNGNELAALVKSRRVGVDADLEAATDVFTALEVLVRQHGPDYQRLRIIVPRDRLRRMLIDRELIDGNKIGPKATTSYIKNLCGTGPLRCLADKHAENGSFWVYTGPSADPDAKPERLAQAPTPMPGFPWDGNDLTRV